jgi:hypothetical protein
MRILLALVLVAGCSSSSTPAGGGDLAVPADLTTADDLAEAPCTVSVSGDVTVTESCMRLLCHAMSTPPYDELTLNSGSMISHFAADGGFTARSYAVADLKSFTIDFHSGGKSYQAYKNSNSTVVGTAAITVTNLGPFVSGCAPTEMHGTATATAVEYDPSTGMTGAGSVTVAFAF